MMRVAAAITLVLAACAPSKEDSQDVPVGAGDDTAAACVASDEIPYDGVDQDCSGADLRDVDGDGHDAVIVGGDDCDDAVPGVHAGAEEIPYDGVDQDCDGADLVDVDGDGHMGTEVGGDDCDDGSASAYPGALEILGNSSDDDCDGRTDEHLVCADGSGEFTTVQEGVDGVPDGSVLELCPGVYAEEVLIDDQEIDIEGGGDSPEDVVLKNAGDEYTSRGIVTVTGPASVVTIGYLRIFSDATDERIGVSVEDGEALTVDRVMMCDSDGFISAKVLVVLSSFSPATGTDVTVSNSYFCADAGQYDPAYLMYLYLPYGGSTTFTGNTAVSDGAIAASRDGFRIGIQGASDDVIANNLFVRAGVVLIQKQGDVAQNQLVVRNNTFATIGLLQFYAWADAYTAQGRGLFPSVVLDDNIFYSVDSTAGDPLWWAWWATYGNPTAADVAIAVPSEFSSNVVWNVSSAPFAMAELRNGITSGPRVLTVDVSRAFDAGRINGPPEFATTEEQGSYGLATGSPAVDEGSGESDPDGSPNDIGAFGGPNGNWYQEVPWQLP